MAKKVKGFRVGLKEREVVLVASQDGREHRLTHTLNQPTSKDWIDYERSRASVKLRGRKSKIESTALQAKAELYDKLIISVDGYYDEESKKQVGPEVENWKDKIPVLHKSEVLETFGEVCPEDENDPEKN